MIIGARAHDFGKLKIQDLAKKISQREVSSIQLALGKAIADFKYDLGMLTPGMANHIKEVFYMHGLSIAVLGCYVNIIHPDEDERRKLFSKFKEHIRYVRDFGCSIVGTETGSVNHDYSFNPKNHGDAAFETLMESVRELVSEAEKFGVTVCIEGVTTHVINTPVRMKKAIDRIQSNNLQVIFDPVNFLSMENYHDQDRVMKESFELFGDRIIIVHAKDFVIEDGEMKTVEAGKGLLNYELLLKLIKTHKPYIQVLLENAKEGTIDESIKHLKEIYDRV